MRRAAIVSPARTPVGKFMGALSSISAGELAAHVIRVVVDRSGVDPERIDDVVFAQGYPSGEAPCIARWAALAAGLPIRVPGYQLDRRCGGGLQAIIDAAMIVQTGAADVVVAGGVDSMSQVEFYSNDVRGGRRLGSVTLHDRLVRAREMAQPAERCGRISGMIETAENLAKDYGISREACDAYALSSQQKAAAAQLEGKFTAEMAPLTIPQRKGDPVLIDLDEGIRAGVTLDQLAALKPIGGGVVTAGNASQQNDAAAACLVVAEDCLEQLGLEPMAHLTGWAVAGCEPSRMGLGPAPAVEKLFQRTGLTWEDLDLVELNEAFAAQVLAVLAEWQWHDPERLNVNGSGISLGHPIGATGIRILTTLLHEMKRRQSRYGLETMCIGGGQGIAAIFERP